MECYGGKGREENGHGIVNTKGVFVRETDRTSDNLGVTNLVTGRGSFMSYLMGKI